MAAEGTGQIPRVNTRIGSEGGKREGGSAALGKLVAQTQQPARRRRASARLPRAEAQQFERQPFDDERRGCIRTLELVEQPNRQADQRTTARVERLVQRSRACNAPQPG